MRMLVLVPLICVARARTARRGTGPDWAQVPALAQTPPPAPAQQKPPPTPAPEKPPATPAPGEAAATGGAGTGRSGHVRSLFEPTWRQFEIRRPVQQRGRRPGAIPALPGHQGRPALHRCAISRARTGGRWLFRAAADNVGWRDQRFFGDYERTGRFVISGLWDEIPQFYSVDTRTPYTQSGGPLLLDDATQRAIQNGAGEPQRRTCRSRRSSISGSAATSAT